MTPQQVKDIWPLCHTDDLVGAIQHPEDGYIQPADLTQALATGARSRGAEIYRNTTVLSMRQTKEGWIVETDKGSIECEHVISCSGNFARQTGEMVGLDIPVIPVEHQYIVTEPHPEIQKRKKEGLPEMGVLRDSDSRWYMREEAGGLILGPYEDGAPACYVEGPSKDSEYELFQEDLDRLAPHIEGAIHRVPAFGEVGVKKVYNGAICYTPDGNPIVGPAWGLKNFWINEGHSFGITAAGGAGWQLAEWNIEGEPTIDKLADEKGLTLYKRYTIGPGKNYKDISYNVPLKFKPTGLKLIDDANKLSPGKIPYTDYDNTVNALLDEGYYLQEHTPDINSIGRVRVADRVDAEGKATKHLDEVQSEFARDSLRYKVT